MTLLVCSLRRMDVVMSADSRSIETRDGKIVRVFDKLQKMFPVEGQPIVLAQHGQNVFDGHPVRELLKTFAKTLPPGMSVTSIADRVREAMHGEIRHTLQQLDPSNAVGVWVVGFGAGEDEPRQAEIFWKFEGDELVIREGHWHATDVLLAGSGKEGLHVDLDRIVDGSVETVRAMHAELYASAMRPRDGNVSTVGGPVHELVVTPSGWRWLAPPAS